jgi:transcriptional regulator with XRE-family HTH domain
MNNPDKVRELLRAARQRSGLTQREAARRARLKTARYAHVEQGYEIATTTALRSFAHAVEATGSEAIQLIVWSAQKRKRAVLDVEGLTGGELFHVAAIIERYRRRKGLVGACSKCNARPGQTCAKGCPCAAKKAGRHG